jgi:2-hydroxycyclohexanecarboxyl-CoA dehydrogenase
MRPGPTDTALLDQVARQPELYDSLARAIPLHRIGQPTTSPRQWHSLAGDGADFITGQTLSVSGSLDDAEAQVTSTVVR